MRRIAANYIFPVSAPPIRNGILEMDDAGRIVRVVDPGENFRELRKLEFYNGVLVPGFINAHCHLELACLKGSITYKPGLAGFVRQVQRLRNSCDPQKQMDAMVDADRQMKNNGTAAVADVSNTAVSFPLKAKSRLTYLTFIELYGFSGTQITSRIDMGRALLQQLREDYNLQGYLSAHAPYTSDARMIRLIVPELQKEDAPVFAFHHREASRVHEWMIRFFSRARVLYREQHVECRYWGVPGIRKWMAPLMPVREKCQLLPVHNLHTTQREIRYAVRHFPRLTWVLCPRSNMHIHGCLPALLPFIREQQTMALGTDSLASNESLSILEEMKILARHHPELPFATLLEWATINGARALFPDTSLGRFEPGGRPGVNLIQPFDFTRMSLTADSHVFRLA